MNRYFRILPVLLLSGAAMLPHARAQESGAPVLLSESFENLESGTPPGWKSETAGELAAIFGADTRRPRDGKASWRVRVPAWDSGAAVVSHSGLPLKGGATCSAVVWMRAEGPSQPVRVSLAAASSQPLSRAFYVAPAWRRYVLTGVPSQADGAGTFSIALRGTGTLWVDGVQVVQGPPPPEPEPSEKDADRAAPEPVKGNRVYNSSFELGAAGWASPEQVGVSEGKCPDGERFARCAAGKPALECRPFAVRPGQEYVVSAYLRGAAGASVEVAAVEVGNAARVARTFELAPEWRRYTFTTKLPCDQYARYFVQLRGDGTAAFDADAVQVEEGTVTGYRPQAVVEVATGLTRGKVYPHPDEWLDIPVQLYAAGKIPENVRVRYRLTGFYGDLVETTQLPAPPGATRATVPFRTRVPALGSLRLTVESVLDGEVISSDETMVTTLPPTDARPEPDSFFGMGGGPGSAPEWHPASVGARAGARWWRLGEPVGAPDSPLSLDAREVEALRARGLSILAPVPGAGRAAEAASHYRGRIAAYEVAGGSPGAIRQADAAARVVGATAASLELLRALDVIGGRQHTSPEAVSFLRGGKDAVTLAIAGAREKIHAAGGKQPIWITDGSVAAPSYYSWAGLEEQSRAAARALAKTLVLAKANGVQRYFYGRVKEEARFDRLLSGNEALLDYDGGGKTALGAYAACAEALEGAEPAGKLEGANLKAYFFRKGADTVVAAWSPTAFTDAQLVEIRLNIQRVRVTNIMGNLRGAKAVPMEDAVSVALRNEPTYILLRQTDPAAAAKAVRAVAIDPTRKPRSERKPK